MSENHNNTSQDKSAVFAGVIATLVGLFIVLVSVDIIHTDPESIHTPRWVLTLAGLTFACAGLLFLSRGLLSSAKQRDPIVQWFQYLLTTGMLTAFASVFLWVGFGPGEREFSASGSFLFLTISGAGNAIIGRILFGGTGVLIALVTIFAAIGGANKIMTEGADRDEPNE
jgi:uncharacterized membrane protein HdeD (DUF308 family)